MKGDTKRNDERESQKKSGKIRKRRRERDWEEIKSSRRKIKFIGVGERENRIL